MRWHYAPANQPPWVSNSDMLALINASMAKWSAVCGIKFEYQGSTTAAPTSNDGINVIGWSYAQGNDGYTQYWFAGANNGFTDVDVRLDPNRVSSTQQLEGLVNHELGHAIGITHSDVSSAIMYATPYNTYEYQATLRADDIAACVAIYGAPSTSTPTTPSNANALSQAEADCLFNWGEDNYRALLSPSRPASFTVSSFYARYYSGSGAYVGVSSADDHFYYLAGGASSPIDLGLAASWSAQAQCR